MSLDVSSSPSPPKALCWAGWLLTIVPAAMLLMSGAMKFGHSEQLAKGFEMFGLPAKVAVPLGVAEIASTILFLIPQTAVLGAILLTGYLGGAIATHVRVEDNFVAPALLGVIIWLALFLREPRLRALLPWRT